MPLLTTKAFYYFSSEITFLFYSVLFNAWGINKICPSLRCGCPVDTSAKQKHRPSRQARPPHKRRGNPSLPFLGITDYFALTTLAVPKSCYSLGARTTFDRGASFCSLLPAPQALATSLRMTNNLVIAREQCDRGNPFPVKENTYLFCAQHSKQQNPVFLNHIQPKAFQPL